MSKGSFDLPIFINWASPIDDLLVMNRVGEDSGMVIFEEACSNARSLLFRKPIIIFESHPRRYQW